MPVDSLKDALHLMRSSPALWLLGVVFGALGTLNLLLQLGGESQMERFTVLQLLVIPFFIAGGLYAVHRTPGSISGFLEGGRKYYTRILLATLVIVFAAILTILLLTATMAILGMGADTGMLFMIPMGVAVPVICFTYFYDTAIVVDERRILDSIRRSVEFVFLKPIRTLAFFILNMAILLIFALLSSFFWAILLAERLEPLISINETALQPIPMNDLLKSLGIWEIGGIAFVWFAALTFGVTFLYAYKFSFFRRYSKEEAPAYGEYDEKGRWYRY
jgi:hypothetical protein